MKIVYWEVRPLGAPEALRYCKRCAGKTAFVSSGLFRVNAQQKALDVWLIYKCGLCDATWNMTVHSRVASRGFTPEALHAYTNNDAALAMRHAMDAALIKRNGAESLAPRVEILGPDIDETQDAEIHLLTRWSLDIKLSAILREKLGLSRSAFERRCKQGRIACASAHDLAKARLEDGMVVRVRPEEG